MICNDRKIEVMGIVNLTDDSYFAESRCQNAGKALKRVETMLEQGADIIDIGACSTRPGALPVSEEEQWRRLEPVLKEVHAAFPSAQISIDTTFSSIVSKAYDVIGSFIVNDITAGEGDPVMLDVAGRLGLGYVAMHMRGNPQTMQSMTSYDDVVNDVRVYFEGFSRRAAAAGIKEWILDPGFGFAKTIEQNYELLSGLVSLKTDYGGYSPRLLVGISRKSMIHRLLDITPEEALPATQAVHMAALIGGADILRVHDVAEAVQTIKLYKHLQLRPF
jgi:dihydropteroate synthase